MQTVFSKDINETEGSNYRKVGCRDDAKFVEIVDHVGEIVAS